ncbi:glycosyltransferase family 2 protein [Candidatus Altiarchaeota archaeon]
MKVAVVMPAYNVGKTIEGVFNRLPGESLSRISEFIVIDDGSIDDTVEKVIKLSGSHPIILVRHGTNRGYGAAQKTGYDQALADGMDVIVLLHSDGQYPPEMILEMIRPIEEGRADVVGGSRILGGRALEGGMPQIKYYGNICLTRLQNLVLGMDLTCYHSGYKAYSRRALESLPYARYSKKFHFDSEMLVGLKRAGLRIVELPIPTRYGGEKSHLNCVTYGFSILGVLVRYLFGRI